MFSLLKRNSLGCGLLAQWAAGLPPHEPRTFYYRYDIHVKFILWLSKYQLTFTQVIGYMAGMGTPSHTAPTFLEREAKAGRLLMGCPLFLIGCRACGPQFVFSCFTREHGCRRL